MTEKPKRITYNHVEDKVVVSRGEEKMNLDLNVIFEDEALKNHLVVYGFKEYLRRAAADAAPEDKMEEIEKAYDRMESQGVDVFSRSKPSRGPNKAEKISALAILNGTTTVAVQQALDEMEKDEQDRVLNSDRVKEKLEELDRNGEDLQLSA